MWKMPKVEIIGYHHSLKKLQFLVYCLLFFVVFNYLQVMSFGVLLVMFQRHLALIYVSLFFLFWWCHVLCIDCAL
jgi:hypothetical protein